VDQVLSNLPATIALVVLVIIVVAATIRLGPQFVVKRLAGLIFVLAGVTFVTFILGYISPGSPVELLCGEKCTEARVEDLNHFYGLDKPWYEQYQRFVTNLLHFNLGNSYALRGRSVWDVMGIGVPVSVQLGLMAVAVQLLVGIPLGVLAARRAGTRFDTVSMGLALVAFSLPTFVTIPLYQIVTVFLALNHIPHLPVAGWGDPYHEIAPVGLLGLVGLGFYARLTRTTMLDVLNQDYIRTARAKGLAERVITFRHAFRNALVPLVTAIGPALAFVVGGAVFTETLFNIPGIGFYAVNSILAKDMPVVQGTVTLVAIAVALMNLVVDVVYGLLDPRIKVQ
jgi:ABC-type dipeptide/oligopeptide/nickel transport system permease component